MDEKPVLERYSGDVHSAVGILFDALDHHFSS